MRPAYESFVYRKRGPQYGSGTHGSTPRRHRGYSPYVVVRQFCARPVDVVGRAGSAGGQ